MSEEELAQEIRNLPEISGATHTLLYNEGNHYAWDFLKRLLNVPKITLLTELEMDL